MLDRLKLSIVSLPDVTYDVMLLLSETGGLQQESKGLLSPEVFQRLYRSLKPGGRIQSTSDYFENDKVQQREAIFAGFLVQGGQLVKPQDMDIQSVPLKLGTKSRNSEGSTNSEIVNVNGKGENWPLDTTAPQGVGFVDFSDDFTVPEADFENSDDELIDENTLLDEEDMKRPVIQRKSHN